MSDVVYPLIVSINVGITWTYQGESKLIFYSQIDLKPLFQTVLKILNKPNSLMDWRAYASNPLFLVIKMDYLMSWTTMTK